MNEVRTEIALVDQMTAPIMSMQSALGGLENTLNAVDNATDIDTSGFDEMSDALVLIEDSLNAVSNAANIDTSGFNAMQAQITSADNAASLLVQAVLSIESTLRGMAAAQLGFMSGIQQAASDYEEIKETTEEIVDDIDNAAGAQDNFNNSARQGDSIFDGMLGKITAAAAAYASIRTVGTVLNMSDNLSTTTSRLNLINDGLQTTEELQNDIFAAAQRSHGQYSLMAESVASLGLQAKDAFANNGEIIAFTETMNKNFKIGGQDIASQSAAMRQLTQAMGAGRLQGDELVSVMEGAPMVVQAIADYLDVDIAKLRELSSEGAITTEIIKGAVFAMADETNAAFEQIPITFEDISNNLKDRALMAFQPFLRQLNDVANSDAFNTLVDNAANRLSELASSSSFQSLSNGIVQTFFFVSAVLLNIFDLVFGVAQFTADNWSILAPIILGAAAAWGVYSLAVNWSTITEKISLAITTGLTIARWAAVAVMAVFGKTISATTAAQWGLNSAMLANPAVLIVMGILLIVAAVYAVTAAYNKWTDSTVSATGLIFGAFSWLWAVIFNNIVLPWQNTFAAVANFFGNVFNDPVTAIQVLFADLAVNVVGHINRMAHAVQDIINKIPGVEIDITGGIDNLYSELQKDAATVKASGEWTEYVKPWTEKDYEEAWNSGYKMGEGIDETIKNFDPMSLLGDWPPEDLLDDGGDGQPDLSDMGSSLNNIDNNTKKQLDYSEEELKLWRDIAERDTINRYTTAQVSINMGGVNNNVSSDIDLDGMVNKFGDLLEQKMFEAAEGVHF